MTIRKTLKEYFLHFDIEKLCFMASVVIFTIMYVSVLRFILSTGISLLNSDSSSEMVLSAQLNREGAFLFTKNWFYGSEIRVLNTMPIFRISLAMFPNNWHWARLFSVAMLLLILAGSMIWLMCSIGQKKCAFWAAIAVIAPFGRWYGWNVIFNSYYVPHIVISILSLALVCTIVRNDKKQHPSKKIVFTLLLFALGFFAGLGGVRQLLVCYVPLFAISIILLYLNDKQFLPVTFPAKFIFLISFFLCLFSGIGCLINSTYLSKHYHFNTFTDITWEQFSLNNYISCISLFISLFGWQENVPIFSLAGIVNALSLLLVGTIIWSIIYLVIRIKSLADNEILITLFFCTAFLVNLLIFGGVGQPSESYWIPILPFAFIPLFIAVSKTAFSPIRKIFILIGYGFLLLLSSYLTMKSPYIDSPINGRIPDSISIQNVSNWLNETEYTQGIASFWNSNIITELSDGDIEMWTITGGRDKNLTPRPWLQSVEHETLPAGKVFLLLTLPEFHDMELPDALEEYIVYSDDDYIVYGFDDINQYFELINE